MAGAHQKDTFKRQWGPEHKARPNVCPPSRHACPFVPVCVFASVRLPSIPAEVAKMAQAHILPQQADLLPRYGCHHHQIHQVVNRTVPVAGHVPMRSVQIRFTLREALERSPL